VFCFFRVITLKRDETGSIVFDPDSNPSPFSIPDKNNKPVVVEGTRKSKRLTSTTKRTQLNKSLSNTQVLALEYCKTLKMLAVCCLKEGDESNIYVSLYEPKNLTLVKTLPPLNAWPVKTGMDSDWNKQKRGRDTIKTCILDFDFQIIYLRLDYCYDLGGEFFMFQLI